MQERTHRRVDEVACRNGQGVVADVGNTRNIVSDVLVDRLRARVVEVKVHVVGGRTVRKFTKLALGILYPKTDSIFK